MLRVATYSQRTDTGRQRRANEDAHFARAPLFAIADGMGGAQAGEVASGIAIEVLAEGLPPGPGTTEELLADRIREANERIHELSINDRAHAGMGTTATVAYVGEHEVTIAHVGDSRAYLLRDGAFVRLTQDHSLVEEFVRQGKLTQEEADEHPQRSIITRALGAEAEVDVDLVTVGGRAGDVFLLCSDGLTSMIPDAQVAETIRGARDLDEAARLLVDAANEAGGRDNITVVLFSLEEVTQGPDESEGAAASELTLAGVDAPTATEVRAALAAAPPAAPVAERPAPRAARVEEPMRRRLPRMPARAPRRGRGRRWLGPLVVTLVIAVPLLGGAYLATRAVYFIGVTDDGVVAVFKGLPYRLPAGIELYSTEYVTGVTVAQLPRGRRSQLLDHRLRSHDDARDLARQLELGQLTPR